jgi:metal-dependent amidase/aminoacylase/carboxypeptidase family protein
MIGTIRTLDTEMQKIVHEKIKLTAEKIAESTGATAEVKIHTGYPVTFNNPQLTAKMLPSLEKAAGESNVRVVKATTGAEDFSFFAQKVPGLFFFLGGKPRDVDTLDASQHHTPDFYIDESGFIVGMRALAQLVIDTN